MEFIPIVNKPNIEGLNNNTDILITQNEQTANGMVKVLRKVGLPVFVNFVKDFINAGSFSTLEEFKLSNFSWDSNKTYRFEVTKDVDEVVTKGVYIGRKYYDGPQATDCTYLEFTSFIPDGKVRTINLDTLETSIENVIDGASDFIVDSVFKPDSENAQSGKAIDAYFESMRITVDDHWDTESTNPIQQKLIGKALQTITGDYYNQFQAINKSIVEINNEIDNIPAIKDFINAGDFSTWEELVGFDWQLDKTYIFEVSQDIAQYGELLYFPKGVYIGRFYNDGDRNLLDCVSFTPDGMCRQIVIPKESGEPVPSMYSICGLFDLVSKTEMSDLDKAYRGFLFTVIDDSSKARCVSLFDVIEACTLIKDTGNYYESNNVEGALQEIGATLDGLEELLAGI